MVTIVSGPVLAETVTCAVAVVEPALFVAVSVYVVVAAGTTVVEPLADVELRPPGVIEILVAPVVDQLKTLLEPDVMLVGLAVKELIDGLLGASTVTVKVEVVEPVALVAVSV